MKKIPTIVFVALLAGCTTAMTSTPPAGASICYVHQKYTAEGVFIGTETQCKRVAEEAPGYAPARE